VGKIPRDLNELSSPFSRRGSASILVRKGNMTSTRDYGWGRRRSLLTRKEIKDTNQAKKNEMGGGGGEYFEDMREKCWAPVDRVRRGKICATSPPLKIEHFVGEKKDV